MWTIYPAWTYPEDRYYYRWYDVDPPAPGHRDLKAEIVDRLRDNQYTKDDDVRVDVIGDAVTLTGEVGSPRAKRAAGDDAWDLPGVADVSNQLHVRRQSRRGQVSRPRR